MSTKVTAITVSINCKKCKTGVLKVVAKLTVRDPRKSIMFSDKSNTFSESVDEVKLDAEKGILTVVGSADPVCVATKLRKAGYFAEITSFGPPKKPDEDKKKSPEKPKPIEPLPQFCKQCQLIGVTYVTYDTPSCSIL